MKKILIWVMAFLFLSMPALADEQIDLSTDGNDQLHAYALPDGRTIFAGSAAVKGNYQDSRARLLCMNPDGSVAWEYLHPSKGSCRFGHVQALPDGMIGAIFSNSPNQDTEEVLICKFSPDGKMAAEPISIYTEDILVSGATPDCIAFVVIPGDAQSYYRYFVDWDGNILFRLHSESTISGGSEMIPAEDGVILAGRDKGSPALAKITKLDLYGNVLWSKTLLPTLAEADAGFHDTAVLKDGSFAAKMYEQTGNPSVEMDRQLYLTRIDQDGELLWKTSITEAAPNVKQVEDIIEYGGYIVVALPSGSYDGEQPYPYLWFDTATGNFIGKTEQMMQPGLRNYSGNFVILDDGLWIKRDLRQNIENDRMAEMDSCDEVLVKVPEWGK